ncbi:MAG: hypothetical protein HY770_02850 [Chitinivibrionia bacterium]|nr:hypothetical protein [Chitinivibrionia bacterium]
MRHELHVLISMAKIDAALSRCKAELATAPQKKAAVEKTLADIEKTQKEREEKLAGMKKERRTLEIKLEDNAELIKKFKRQLMDIKKNEEYTALLKEIAAVEKNTDAREEKLLMLMDDIEQQESRTAGASAQVSGERERLKKEKLDLDDRERALNEEIEKLNGQKPGFLAELDPQVRKRYDRLLAKLGDIAVANVESEICQGCFSRLPPQTAAEVKLNDRIINCVSCGRILVHYET